MVQYGVPVSTAEQIVKNPQSAEITPCQKKLLEYAGQITHGAYRVTDCQVKELRQRGWTDEQILEARSSYHSLTISIVSQTLLASNRRWFKKAISMGPST